MITAITYDVLALLFLALAVAAFGLFFLERSVRRDPGKSLGFSVVGLVGVVSTVIMMTHHQVAHLGLEKQFFARSVAGLVVLALAIWLLRRSNGSSVRSSLAS